MIEKFVVYQCLLAYYCVETVGMLSSA